MNNNGNATRIDFDVNKHIANDWKNCWWFPVCFCFCCSTSFSINCNLNSFLVCFCIFPIITSCLHQRLIDTDSKSINCFSSVFPIIMNNRAGCFRYPLNLGWTFNLKKKCTQNAMHSSVGIQPNHHILNDVAHNSFVANKGYIDLETL